MEEELEKSLREIEDKKRSIESENIEIISHDALVSVIQKLNIWFDKVVDATLRKFDDLGDISFLLDKCCILVMFSDF